MRTRTPQMTLVTPAVSFQGHLGVRSECGPEDPEFQSEFQLP